MKNILAPLGYTRKYVIKLLSGNIRYRERKGRGRTYGTSALENARRIWESIGCPCTTYFVAEMPRIVRELFGELRLDCQDLEPDLMRLESKMIVAKTKRPRR